MNSLRAALALGALFGLALSAAACGSHIEGGDGGSAGSGGSAPAGLCPAAQDSELTVGVQTPPDPNGSMEVHETVQGAVVAQTAGNLTFQPDGQSTQIVLSIPADLTLPSLAGQHLSLAYGLDQPWWIESAFVLRDGSGRLLLAGIDGTLAWKDDPMFQAADLHLSLGGDCEAVADSCQTTVSHVVVVEGGGAALSLVGGHSGQATLGGQSYQVRLGSAYSGVGDAHCTDIPGSWLNLVIAPAP